MMLALSALLTTAGAPAITLHAFLTGLSFAFPAATICLLLMVFVSVAKSAQRMDQQPFAATTAALRDRLPLFAWCAFGWPLFSTAFSAVKAGIPVLVGFHFDALFIDMDRAIFGRDPWQIAAAIPHAGPVLEFFYLPVWGSLFYFAIALASALADRSAAVLRLIVAIPLAFLIGGVLLAYLLASGGPIFAHLSDPSLGAVFDPLRASLAAQLPPDAPFLTAQEYLESVQASGKLAYGAGISGMPSMHIATVTIYVLFCRKTWLFLPSVALAMIIFVGSVYSGLHYAVDGIVGAIVALISWKISGRLLASESQAGAARSTLAVA